MGICCCCCMRRQYPHFHRGGDEDVGVLEVMLNPNPLLLPRQTHPLHVAASQDEVYLLKACRRGELEKVVDLLDRGVSVHIVDRVDGYTPLHCACDNGRVAQVNSITQEEDPFGHLTTTIYDEASAHEIANKLIRHNINCNIQARNGQTALHICARHYYEAVARTLIQHGGATESVFVEDNDGKFPVDLIGEEEQERGQSFQKFLLAVQFDAVEAIK